MSLKHLTLIIVLALVSIAPLAAISQSAFMFLTFEPGGRANGMGRAYSAIADDGYAMWWNPGATAFNRKGQLGFNHVNWLQGSGLNDMYFEYLGWNQYFEGIGNLNAHIVLLDLGSQEQTDASNNPLGTFHSYDIAGAVGYSYEVIPERLGMGANFKLIYSNLAPSTGFTDTEGKAFSFVFDIGTLYRDVANLSGLNLALVIQNIGPDVTFVDQEQKDPVPMTVRLGTAYTVLDSQINGLILSAEASKILANEDPLLTRFITGWEPFEETIYSAGAEYTYLNLISLRGGYYYDKVGKVSGPSYGIGVNYAFSERYKLSADFSMVPGGEMTDYNKVFSIGFEY
nr:hypothetical protein [Candidatus Cloacimonadota bacterium]